MSNARKLQTEIDRVMKKVDEGVELFDDIWEKVYSAEQQNQKEKYEMDLKKEIKKLQRLRDQIKTWIGSSEVKDKDALVDARKLIETKMEQFKICEKETKTKTYSKEGLAREERLDPAEEAKMRTTAWLGEYIERLQEVLEETEFEIEKLSSGKGKKTNKHLIEEKNEQMANHRFHINKLEGIIRLVNNDRLDVDSVDPLKDDLDYYLDSYKDEAYMLAYDEDYFYESLGLEDMDVVNVDRVTQASNSSKRSDDTASTTSNKSKEKKGNKKATPSSVIPLTIGRARSKSDKKEKEEEPKTTPGKLGRATSTGSSQSGNTIPAAKPPVPAPQAYSSGEFLAIVKRDPEQPDKERQKALREQQARAQAEQLRQQQARQQQEAQLRQQEALRQQQAQAAQQEALKRQQQQEALLQQQKAQQEAAAQQAAQLQAQQQAEQQAQKQQVQESQNNALDSLTSGLVGLGLGNTEVRSNASNPGLVGAAAPAVATPVATDGSSSYLTALNDSFTTAPNVTETDRARQYTPQNPYPTHPLYPSSPANIFDNPAVFEKLGTDCLFFIFYYAQGTYQQYLAARELKKQSWRFHKKYMTWFQRHEEPKVTTDEYEQGTYVYFDYESGWCTRIKTDFRFEYSYLEDSLQ